MDAATAHAHIYRTIQVASTHTHTHTYGSRENELSCLFTDGYIVVTGAHTPIFTWIRHFDIIYRRLFFICRCVVFLFIVCVFVRIKTYCEAKWCTFAFYSRHWDELIIFIGKKNVRIVEFQTYGRNKAFLANLRDHIENDDVSCRCFNLIFERCEL